MGTHLDLTQRNLVKVFALGFPRHAGTLDKPGGDVLDQFHHDHQRDGKRQQRVECRTPPHLDGRYLVRWRFDIDGPRSQVGGTRERRHKRHDERIDHGLDGGLQLVGQGDTHGKHDEISA